MEDPTQKLTRRQALKAGVGVAGAVAAMASGVVPALAHDAAASALWNTGLDSPTANNDGFWEAVEDAMGNTEGKEESDGVFKIELPRTDIKNATIFGIHVEPDFALEGEVTFQRSDGGAMKFEVVLLDQEVNPFLSAWFAQDVKPPTEVFTALHNHYLGDSPQIRFVHGFGTGDPVKLARALYKALSQSTKTPFGHGEEPPGNPGFDAKRVADIIGGEGELTNGILTVSVERKETFKQRGVKLKPAMEIESMFKFQSIGGGKVATNDEFVLLKDEVDAVARALRKRGFMVTALHNHELDIQPELYYIHSWATGSPTDLARDIHAVLELTKSKFK